ncbi:hypothetical protein T439DRAFT_328000 [Meredithblackwellia eburnea MCA 4105]
MSNLPTANPALQLVQHVTSSTSSSAEDYDVPLPQFSGVLITGWAGHEARLRAWLRIKGIPTHAREAADVLMLSLAPSSCAEFTFDYASVQQRHSFEDGVLFMRSHFDSALRKKLAQGAAHNILATRTFRMRGRRREFVKDLLNDIEPLFLAAGIIQSKDKRNSLIHCFFEFPRALTMLQRTTTYDEAVTEAFRWEAFMIQKEVEDAFHLRHPDVPTRRDPPETSDPPTHLGESSAPPSTSSPGVGATGTTGGISGTSTPGNSAGGRTSSGNNVPHAPSSIHPIPPTSTTDSSFFAQAGVNGHFVPPGSSRGQTHTNGTGNGNTAFPHLSSASHPQSQQRPTVNTTFSNSSGGVTQLPIFAPCAPAPSSSTDTEESEGVDDDAGSDASEDYGTQIPVESHLPPPPSSPEISRNRPQNPTPTGAASGRPTLVVPVNSSDASSSSPSSTRVVRPLPNGSGEFKGKRRSPTTPTTAGTVLPNEQRGFAFEDAVGASTLDAGAHVRAMNGQSEKEEEEVVVGNFDEAEEGGKGEEDEEVGTEDTNHRDSMRSASTPPFVSEAMHSDLDDDEDYAESRRSVSVLGISTSTGIRGAGSDVRKGKEEEEVEEPVSSLVDNKRRTRNKLVRPRKRAPSSTSASSSSPIKPPSSAPLSPATTTASLSPSRLLNSGLGRSGSVRSAGTSILSGNTSSVGRGRSSRLKFIFGVGRGKNKEKGQQQGETDDESARRGSVSTTGRPWSRSSFDFSFKMPAGPSSTEGGSAVASSTTKGRKKTSKVVEEEEESEIREIRDEEEQRLGRPAKVRGGGIASP